MESKERCIQELLEENQRLVSLGVKNYDVIFQYRDKISNLETAIGEEKKRNGQLQEKLDEKDNEVARACTNVYKVRKECNEKIGELEIQLQEKDRLVSEQKKQIAKLQTLMLRGKDEDLVLKKIAEENMGDQCNYASPPTLTLESFEELHEVDLNFEEKSPPVLEIQNLKRKQSDSNGTKYLANESPKYPKTSGKSAHDNSNGLGLGFPSSHEDENASRLNSSLYTFPSDKTHYWNFLVKQEKEILSNLKRYEQRHLLLARSAGANISQFKPNMASLFFKTDTRRKLKKNSCSRRKISFTTANPTRGISSRCFLCGVTFPNGKSLMEHQKLVHSDGTRVNKSEKFGWCRCGAMFATLAENKSHSCSIPN